LTAEFGMGSGLITLQGPPGRRRTVKQNWSFCFYRAKALSRFEPMNLAPWRREQSSRTSD